MKSIIKSLKGLFSKKNETKSLKQKTDHSIEDPKYKALVESYTKLGIDRSKLVIAVYPDTVIWSIDQNKIVTELDPSEACKVMHLQVHSVLNESMVESINSSAGIIITNEIHGRGYWRFDFIPQN
jgi:hypothetical protein